MGKKSQRWPIWKITLALLGCVVVSVALFWLSWFTSKLGSTPGPDQQAQLLSLPAFLMMMGVAVLILMVLCVIWLVVRIREARTPPWERGGKHRKY